MTQASSTHTNARDYRNGLLFGVACYGFWGLLPLYFIAIDFASALEIVANRALWTLLLCVLILLVTGGLRQLPRALRDRHQMKFLAPAAGLIAINWLAYVYAANHGQILQASLGYFINPLFTVLLGVVILRERLRKTQWLAMAIGLLAVIIIAVGYGHPPWLALTLAGSFGLYGLAKSYAGRTTGAVASLGVETLLLTPLALILMLWLDHQGQGHFLRDGAGRSLLLMTTGIVTTVPLTMFAAAARRLPLSLVGMLQYLAPSLQFIIAVYVEHEAMPPSRWVGFALIWVALAIISTDAVRQTRRKRRQRRDQAAIEPTP